MGKLNTTTKEIIESIKDRYGWFGRKEDFITACEENGLYVDYIDAEFADVSREDSDDDDTCTVKFGGTATTITIEDIMEVDC